MLPVAAAVVIATSANSLSVLATNMGKVIDRRDAIGN